MDLEEIVTPAASKPVDTTCDNIPLCSNVVFSRCDSNQIGFFVKSLCRYGLWPMATAFRNFSIKTLCESLERCDFDAFNRMSSSKTNCTRCYVELPEAIILAADRAKKSFKGLCLDCVRNHKIDRKDRAKCRIPHFKS